MSKQTFAAVYAGATALVAIIFLGLGYSSPRWPILSMNMPNKDYCLAPERKEQTITDLNKQIMRIGNATMLFLIAVMHQVFRINLEIRESLGTTFTVILVAYLSYTAVWLIRLITKFKRIPTKI